jgi:hypothetical protein
MISIWTCVNTFAIRTMPLSVISWQFFVCQQPI